jgi:hypothetical protein
VLATQMECNELEAASQAQYLAVQQEIDELWQRLIANDSYILMAVLSHAIQNSSVQAAPLGVWEAEAQLALLAPDLAALPERHPATTAAGNLSLKNQTLGTILTQAPCTFLSRLASCSRSLYGMARTCRWRISSVIFLMRAILSSSD